MFLKYEHCITFLGHPVSFFFPATWAFGDAFMSREALKMRGKMSTC